MTSFVFKREEVKGNKKIQNKKKEQVELLHNDDVIGAIP
tara:strand:+ start:249006 stop:249122 length:117 start_codon:yes stop_codon:yes gene_type:complete